VSLLQGGCVVATATGSAQNFASGATQTMQFVSTDPFPASYDEVCFQIDTEF